MTLAEDLVAILLGEDISTMQGETTDVGEVLDTLTSSGTREMYATSTNKGIRVPFNSGGFDMSIDDFARLVSRSRGIYYKLDGRPVDRRGTFR